MERVLIDTQWNVNKDKEIKVGSKLSFNRYIVECKLFEGVKVGTEIKVLIDTQWNVNITKRMERYYADLVLIDTQWNVNLIFDIKA